MLDVTLQDLCKRLRISCCHGSFAPSQSQGTFSIIELEVMALAFQRPVSHSAYKMDSILRPQSGLTRGVQITELPDGCINPDPVIMQETDILMEQYLSPTKLQLLAGTDKLDQVQSLELRVDTSETTLNNFGTLLPNLTVLKLSGSVIPCVRDLGSALHKLEVLWMPRCSLEELDGISSMLQLRELYLAYNELSDLSPLSMLEELEILDLEGNNLDDICQIEYLTLCPKLGQLTLDGNPICVRPTAEAQEEDYDYRETIKKILPALLTLDDKPTEESGSVATNVFDADWEYLEELQRDALVMESKENDKETVSEAGRPTTAALQPATSYRPGSALRPSSGFRPSSAARRPASLSAGRPSSASKEKSKRRPASSDAVEGMEAVSDLTCGMVVCGNPSKALRERRKANTSQESVKKSEPELRDGTLQAAAEDTQFGVKKSVGDITDVGPVEDKDISDLLHELQSWKIEHEKRLEKIRESKAPQVFKIEHDEELDFSGSDLDDDNEMYNDDDVDMDFRPSSAMQQYQQQQQLNLSSRKDRLLPFGPGLSHLNGDMPRSFREDTPKDNPADQDVNTRQRGSREIQEQKSCDDDVHLIKEYERLKELQKQSEGGRLVTKQGALKEIRPPSPGFHPKQVNRPPSSLASPFSGTQSTKSPTSKDAIQPFPKERPRKLRIGPTGLPGSTQQPPVRDIMTPPAKPGLAGVRPSSALPPSGPSSRIRRQLPEVPTLPSRPPVSKS